MGTPQADQHIGKVDETPDQHNPAKRTNQEQEIKRAVAGNIFGSQPVAKPIHGTPARLSRCRIGRGRELLGGPL
jgi:hypothetical protein